MQCVAQAGGGRPGRWPPGSRPSGVQFSRCFRGHQRASQKSDGPPRNTSAVMLREAAGGVKIPPTPAPHRKSKGNQEGFAFQPGWAGLSGLRVNLMIIMTSSQSWLEHSRVSEKGEVLKMFREGLRVSRVCAHSLDAHPVVLAGGRGRGWGGLHAHRRGRMQARRGFPDAPHTCVGQGAACRRVSWACWEVWEEQQD